MIDMLLSIGLIAIGVMGLKIAQLSYKLQEADTLLIKYEKFWWLLPKITYCIDDYESLLNSFSLEELCGLYEELSANHKVNIARKVYDEYEDTFSIERVDILELIVEKIEKKEKFL